MQPGEKRRNARKLVSYPAFIDVGDDKPAIECALCDASQEGAQLAVEDPDGLPNEFILALSSDGAARRRCRVMWRADNSVGVEFLKDTQKGPRAMRRSLTHEKAAPATQASKESLEDQFDIDALTR